jgi:hypothetical protein
MATERTVGRTGTITITSDSYSPFGELPIIPDPPEPVRPEDRKLDRKALGKKFGLNPAEVEELIALPGFPPAGKRITYGEWGWLVVWSERQVDTWVEKQRAEATRILQLIG